MEKIKLQAGFASATGWNFREIFVWNWLIKQKDALVQLFTYPQLWNKPMPFSQAKFWSYICIEHQTQVLQKTPGWAGVGIYSGKYRKHETLDLLHASLIQAQRKTDESFFLVMTQGASHSLWGIPCVQRGYFCFFNRNKKQKFLIK